MVDVSANVAHPVAVDDCPTIQIETVVVALLGVLLRHAAAELCLTDHLPQVLQDELTCVKKYTVISRMQRQTNTRKLYCKQTLICDELIF